MPFCTQCGNQVHETDQFCARCGSRQAAARPVSDLASGITPRTASILCYIPWVGWVAAIVMLASSSFRNNRTVRFHAFQGLYLFVAWLIVQWVLKPLMFLPRIEGFHFPIFSMLQFAIIGIWVFMMVKTSQEQTYSLPIIGELAERSLAE